MEDDARYLIAVGKTGSISEAARMMHISQPALSQRLKNLENKLGVELFDRGSTPLKPTYAGETYLQWAQGMTDSEDLMLRKIADISSTTSRRLQVGVSLPRGNGMLPDIVDEFYKRTKGCTLFLLEAGMPDDHNRLLATSEIDCAVFTPVPPENSIFSGEVICDELMMLIAPPELRIDVVAGEPYSLVSPSAIGSLPFIMPPSNLKHNWVIRSMMDRAGVRLNVKFHSCSNEMTVEMVKRGLGVSIMPNTFLFSQPDDQLSRYAIDGFLNRGHLYYNRRLDGTPSGDETAFIRTLKDWVGRHPELAHREAS